MFGWALGAERGVKEMNRGADFRVPRFMAFMVRWITPTFLIVILVAWTATNAGDYLDGMSPAKRTLSYARAVYIGAITEHFVDDGLSDEELTAKTEELLGAEDTTIDAASLPGWLQASQQEADQAAAQGPADANVARFVFIGMVIFLILLIALGDIACRGNIGRSIRRAEQFGAGLPEAEV